MVYSLHKLKPFTDVDTQQILKQKYLGLIRKSNNSIVIDHVQIN